MEGHGAIYSFTLSVLLHIALCICVKKCLTWLGNWGLRWDFRHGLALLFLQFYMHCFCGTIVWVAFLCCVVSFVAVMAYNHLGVVASPQEGLVLTKRVVLFPKKGWLYPPKKWA